MTLQKCTPFDSPCICDFQGYNCRVGRIAEIDLNQGILNERGNLRFHGTNFSESCSNLHLDVQDYMFGSVTLHATCKIGAFWTVGTPSILDLNTGISNNKGVLEFDR